MTDAEEFFYEGGGRRAAVDTLLDGVLNARPLMVLSGPSGSGCGVVIRRFIAEADPAALAIALVTGDILMSMEQCAAALMQALAAAGAQSSGNLQDMVTDLRAQHRVPVLVLEDAHELGEETRNALLVLARACEVSLVLTGDDTLRGLVGADGAVFGIPLRAFSVEEAEDFVVAVLVRDGVATVPSRRLIKRLHRQSQGLPGGLVKLLRAGAAKRSALIPEGFPLWHVLFAVLAMLLLLWLVSRSGAESARVTGGVDQSRHIALPAPAVAAEAGMTRTAKLAVPALMEKMRPLALPPVVARQMPEAVPPDTVNTAVSTARAIPSPSQVASRLSLDEAALLQESGARFTLQLFAGLNEQVVRQLASRHPGADMKVLRMVRDNQPWHVVIVGVYDSKDAAQAASARLPAELQALNPWARSLDGLQEALRQRRD